MRLGRLPRLAGCRSRKKRIESFTELLCGDVMTGRGIDQILPTPSSSELHEPYLKSALRYVDLAESASGRIPRQVAPSYIWGDALKELQLRTPDLRVINLETAITTHDEWEDKGINYRMHPRNIECLTVAGINCAVLSNNHILDWGDAGLLETIEILHAAGIQTAGAGNNIAESLRPAVLPIRNEGRVLVFAFGSPTAGLPEDWAATPESPGVSLMNEAMPGSIKWMKKQVTAQKRSNDVAVVSIHWGSNWGYAIPEEQRHFAHALIDEAGIDVVHGHSSHHPKGMEVYRSKLILYGCGDFLNDYEGIGGYEEYRGDLALLYFPVLDSASGALVSLEIVPMQRRRFSLHKASLRDARWLFRLLNREGESLGTSFEQTEDSCLKLRWKEEFQTLFRRTTSPPKKAA